MFIKAQIKLTLLYSLFSLVLFWLFSFGLYQWMNSSFGEGYISQVQGRSGIESDAVTGNNTKIVTVAGDVALDQLLRILLTLNGTLIIVVPVASWFLAKRTLDPMKNMHELQKQFVTDASHELRTPLSIMSGELEVSLKKKRSISEYVSTLVSTKEEVDRLSSLTENLLFLAREDTKKSTSQFETVDITDLLSSVVDQLTPNSRKKEVSITLRTKAKSSPTVFGNQHLLGQLFYNLINNAITYTPKKGQINVSITEQEEAVAVAIRDTGIGISQEDQEKIFNRFYRVDASRSEVKGYGLGLAIAQAVITKHKGKMLLSSQLHKGSTFTVILSKP